MTTAEPQTSISGPRPTQPPVNDPFPAPSTNLRDYLADAIVTYERHDHEASDYDHDFDEAAARKAAEDLLTGIIRAHGADGGSAQDDTPVLRPATRNSPAPIRVGYLGSFARSASTEPIRIHLAARRADRRALDRHIADLEALLAHRKAQIAAGTWPPPLTPAEAALKAARR